MVREMTDLCSKDVGKVLVLLTRGEMLRISYIQTLSYIYIYILSRRVQCVGLIISNIIDRIIPYH